LFVNSQLIGPLLRSLRNLEAIVVRAEQLAALEQAYVAAIPREFAARSRVAYERAGAIVVLADTSAVAAKLRQLAPRIVARIVKSAPEITSMRVEVQIAQHNNSPPRVRPTIGADGLASLRELRDALPDSPLRVAIGRLVSRREGLDRQDKPFQSEEGKDDQD
jgi:Dna[CI] antecedent, DciA